ncbi:LamG-like jellyroll fold domain-containing protein [Aliiglaciecola lipolytica]|uniref:LamG-like jellyroll fold domain-containing protein n=1 Tax=Aliiglaciecola lipolytica E3 TaxID=1127673 RepID=K6XN56_9ALTE|nr:LamG-like jellyroll fold domain-containing protein [Aliiglaciecola lipolytica]GAC13116.1 hypothetical protein GLIP_0470 [Aliiglaciecola lipolytica E3]
MSDLKSQKQRFEQLLGQLLDNAISASEVDELLCLAQLSDEFKFSLRAQLEMDFLLTQTESAEAKEGIFVAKVHDASKQLLQHKEFEKRILQAIEDNPEGIRATQDKAPKKNNISGLSRTWNWTALSIAACAVLTFFFFLHIDEPENYYQPSVMLNEVNDNGVAVIVNVVNNSQHFKAGESVIPGNLQLLDGFLELEFYHGARLKIAGPADLDIINEQRVMLRHGKVMTDVPYVAIGFTIDTPNSEVIDLGTAIGVSVDHSGKSQIHVFDGLIETKDKQGETYRLAKGGAISQGSPLASEWQLKNATSSLFSEFSNINDLTITASNRQQRKWHEMKQWVLKDESLVAYYDFEKDLNLPRQLTNIAHTSETFHGAIVGANWAQGPWNGKSALEFKKASDRVRVDIKGEFDQFTLTTWIRIDSLDRRFNSILLTDNYNEGDIHWQLGHLDEQNEGKLVLGLKHTKDAGSNYTYQPFYSVSESGTWYHLATTVNQNTRQVKSYINGKLVMEKHLKHRTKSWHINKASIGNWDSTLNISPLRNLNGSIAEMMIFSRALSDDEIKKIALQ